MVPTPPEPGAGGDDLLTGLTETQIEAVTSDANPLCILASAGAGKTRVLTRRIAYRCRMGDAEASHTLALTFTRKAAAELRSRLGELGLRDGVAAGTFHSHAAAQLHRWWADRRQSRPALLERKARLLGPLVDGRPGLAGVPLAEIAGHIEWAKARAIDPDGLAGVVESTGRPLPPGLTAAALGAVYARYEHEKRRRGLVDFDDLLAGCASAIERDPEFAGAQRWRWRHVYVDEFQDLNPLQHRLLLAWLGTSTDLCVVGDPNQAIYGWNGADPRLLQDVPRRWPSTRVLHLDANHRCTEQIVRAAAAALGSGGARLHAAGKTGPAPDLRAYPSERAEAAGVVAGLVGAHREGRPWSAMAVLARTNAQLAVFQPALAAAGVPFWSAAQPGLLDDPSVRDVLAQLGDGSGRPARALLADLHELTRSPSPDREPARALAELVWAFESLEPGGSVVDWLAWLPAAVRDRSGGPGRPGTVTLSSFHRAKGLEWDAVWVAGLEEGLVPIGRPGDDPDPVEERQLLYVALTRAGEELHLSWAETRAFGTRPVPRRPSRWLDPIRLSVATDAPVPSPPGEWRLLITDRRDELRRRAASRGRALGRRTPPDWPEPDGDVQAALRAWRADAARQSGVPPYMLLHDVTIEALAALRPRTMDELLAVPGLGPVKAGRYGPGLLAACAGRAASA